MKTATKIPLTALAALFLGATAMAQPDGHAVPLKSPPPAPFKQVSTLVHLPAYLPPYGTLYVDPATLPAGPFLGYDRHGRLADVIYMIPLQDINSKKNFENLGARIPGLKVDHTDVSYNAGHPGVAMPHIHIVQWLISPAQEAKMK